MPKAQDIPVTKGWQKYISEFVLNLPNLFYEIQTAIHNPTIKKTIPESFIADTYLETIVLDVLAQQVPAELQEQQEKDAVADVKIEFSKWKIQDKEGLVKYKEFANIGEDYHIHILFPIVRIGSCINGKVKVRVRKKEMLENQKATIKLNEKEKWVFHPFIIKQEDIYRIMGVDRTKFIKIKAGNITPNPPEYMKDTSLAPPSCLFTFQSWSTGKATFEALPGSVDSEIGNVFKIKIIKPTSKEYKAAVIGCVIAFSVLLFQLYESFFKAGQ